MWGTTLNSHCKMYLLIEIISGDQRDRICCIVGIMDHKFMISWFNFRHNMTRF